MTDEKWPGSADPNQTQPIAPPPAGVAVSDPPPSGFEADAPDPDPVDWQGRYLEQKRRTTLFIGTTVVAVAALIGSLFFAMARGNAVGEFTRDGINGPSRQFGGPGGAGMPGQGHMPGRGFDQDDFDDDSDEADDSADSLTGQVPQAPGQPGHADPGTTGQTT